MAGEVVFTVARLNEYADRILKSDPRLRSIKVSGELSGVKRHTSGHLYFNLVDDEASVSCVMFRYAAAKLTLSLEEGMRVVVRGSVGIFMKDGRFQLYVESIKADGQGELYRQFLLLKDKLQAEGVFSNQRPIPFLPRSVGVATSETGAAVHDIVTVIKRRFPRMNILLAPCQVQGDAAPKEICAAIRALQRFEKCDVIIVGRGGGSYEDLSCFNDEDVARTIFASKIPVVSAVGHEVDFTIADLAADLRAPTPSAAAELVCPEYADLEHELKYNTEQLSENTKAALNKAKSSLAGILDSAALANPKHVLKLMGEKLHGQESIMTKRAQSALGLYREKLSGSCERLRALDPKNVLLRGYSIVTDENGHILSDASKLSANDKVGITFASGSASAVISEIKQ